MEYLKNFLGCCSLVILAEVYCRLWNSQRKKYFETHGWEKGKQDYHELLPVDDSDQEDDD